MAKKVFLVTAALWVLSMIIFVVSLVSLVVSGAETGGFAKVPRDNQPLAGFGALGRFATSDAFSSPHRGLILHTLVVSMVLMLVLGVASAVAMKRLRASRNAGA